MIRVDLDNVFYDGWGDVVSIITTSAMARAILSAFSDDIVYYSGGVTATPTEEQSEVIEEGIADVTTAIT